MEDFEGHMQATQSVLKRCLKVKSWLKIPRTFIKWWCIWMKKLMFKKCDTQQKYSSSEWLKKWEKCHKILEATIPPTPLLQKSLGWREKDTKRKSPLENIFLCTSNQLLTDQFYWAFFFAGNAQSIIQQKHNRELSGRALSSFSISLCYCFKHAHNEITC